MTENAYVTIVPDLRGQVWMKNLPYPEPTERRSTAHDWETPQPVVMNPADTWVDCTGERGMMPMPTDPAVRRAFRGGSEIVVVEFRAETRCNRRSVARAGTR